MPHGNQKSGHRKNQTCAPIADFDFYWAPHKSQCLSQIIKDEFINQCYDIWLKDLTPSSRITNMLFFFRKESNPSQTQCSINDSARGD
jgi:hypothetical protein